MFSRLKYVYASFVTTFVVLSAASGAVADDLPWRVSKSSGEVWVTTSEVQQASLADEALLKAGDNIRTGRNGRVLLVRSEERILIAPNSVIAIPAEHKDGLTTIVQQAGSALLNVEKRNVEHFQVETPYLAAVVKGTQFRVSVNAHGASVDVLRGQVDVADFKSGQHALVLHGQAAKVSTLGPAGLLLNGSGPLSPIQQGDPRTSLVKPVSVPKEGLSAPRDIPDGQRVRGMRIENPAGGTRSPKAGGTSATLEVDAHGHVRTANGALRITAPLGEVKLNVHKVTNGLARGETSANVGRGNAAKETVWSSGELTPGNGVAKIYNQSNSNALGGGNSLGNSNANGNGAGNSNANANANANSGNNGRDNGNGNGNGNGNDNGHGNGNGNGNDNGHGNGNGNGHGHRHGKN